MIPDRKLRRLRALERELRTPPHARIAVGSTSCCIVTFERLGDRASGFMPLPRQPLNGRMNFHDDRRIR
jgi:hypothetical protein